jgi:16S rRNA (cytidine1402-2'-O)-methyltransferase
MLSVALHAAAAQAPGHAASSTLSTLSSIGSSAPSSTLQQQQQRPQQQQEPALEQALYVVGTPIGNLEDISFRALRILRGASLILAEDTRHTRKLLQHFAIRTPTLSCHQHNERQRQELVLRRLQAGEVLKELRAAASCVVQDFCLGEAAPAPAQDGHVE